MPTKRHHFWWVQMTGFATAVALVVEAQGYLEAREAAANAHPGLRIDKCDQLVLNGEHGVVHELVAIT